MSADREFVKIDDRLAEKVDDIDELLRMKR